MCRRRFPCAACRGVYLAKHISADLHRRLALHPSANLHDLLDVDALFRVAWRRFVGHGATTKFAWEI
jgi:hypothetical protein